MSESTQLSRDRDFAEAERRRHRTGKVLLGSLTVVLPDGSVIRKSRRARKSSAGYDLTRLFVGLESTLGVFTEVTVRLHGIPKAISAAICSFPSVEAAVSTVTQNIQAGIQVARMELADAARMESLTFVSSLMQTGKVATADCLSTLGLLGASSAFSTAHFAIPLSVCVPSQ
jgi:FAD/FMN-containing dehydrogenase